MNTLLLFSYDIISFGLKVLHLNVQTLLCKYSIYKMFESVTELYIFF